MESRIIKPWQDIQVFSPEWFKVHQKRLLWLLNNESSYIKDYFRYTLGISRDYEQAIITELRRDSFDLYNGSLHRVGVFYSGAPFAEALYHSYLPIWKAVHAFDMKFANKFLPELNLGFDNLDTFTQAGSGGSNTTCDGAISSSASADWDVVKSGNNLSVASLTATTALVNGSKSGSLYSISRYGATFDTSPLGIGATLSGASLCVICNATSGSADSATYTIVSFSPASNNVFVANDFTTFGSTAYCGPYSLAGWVAGDNFGASLSSTGRGTISTTGISKFGIKCDDSLGWPSGQNYIYARTGDHATDKPFLRVVYTPARKAQQQILL